MKHVLIAAAVLSLGGLVAGCGDNSDSASSAASPSSTSTSPADAPSDASSTDLCSALTAGSGIKDGSDVVDFANGLQQAGTPSDIPDDARKGFEVYVGVLQDIDPKTTATELKNMKNPDLSKTEQTEVQSFLSYAGQACASQSASPSAPSSSAG